MIGEVLVAARAITQAQLDAALQDQRRSGGFLGDSLVAAGAISGDALAKALAEEPARPALRLERLVELRLRDRARGHQHLAEHGPASGA